MCFKLADRPVIRYTGKKIPNGPIPEDFKVFPGPYLAEFLKDAVDIDIKDPLALSVTWRKQFERIRQKPNGNDEVEEFLSTGRSNNRQMEWTILELEPNGYFQMHAHPNIEIIYVAAGTLNEQRLMGRPPSRVFGQGVVNGPDLSHGNYRFSSFTWKAGDYLVNEIGSVHQSSSGPDGCVVLIFWSGSFACINKECYPKNARVRQPSVVL